jgi:hypothetical protein
MDEVTLWEGIIIGSAGGAIAGLVIWLLELGKKEIIKCCHPRRIIKWLKSNGDIKEWRSTRAIASHNNLTEDRVRFICSNSSRIKLNTKDGNHSDEKCTLR